MATRYPDVPPTENGKTTIEKGHWFVDYACDQLEKHWGISPKVYHSTEFQLKKGEGRFAEFKHDPHTKYEHLSIEIQERAKASGLWVLSGIFRRCPPYYIQGDKESIWVFPVHMLRRYAESIGIWINWEDQHLHLSDVIDERRNVKTYNNTMRRFYLEYGIAEEIGGIKLPHIFTDANT